MNWGEGSSSRWCNTKFSILINSGLINSVLHGWRHTLDSKDSSRSDSDDERLHFKRVTNIIPDSSLLFLLHELKCCSAIYKKLHNLVGFFQTGYCQTKICWYIGWNMKYLLTGHFSFKCCTRHVYYYTIYKHKYDNKLWYPLWKLKLVLL